MDNLSENYKSNYACYLLPFAFLLHNLEEVLGMEKWLKSNALPDFPPVTTRQFAIGALLITVVGFLIIFSKHIFKSSKNYDRLVTAFAGMIFLNVFFPHLLASMYFGKYTPGVLTAVLINLPLTVLLFFDNIKRKNISFGQTLLLILLGGLIGAPLAILLLKIGEILG